MVKQSNLVSMQTLFRLTVLEEVAHPVSEQVSFLDLAVATVVQL